MKIQGPALFVLVVAVSLAMLAATEVSAQTVCAGSPYLGASGPELCVNVSEDGGASLDFRGPSPITINQTIGDYRLNVIITYAVDGAGMGVTIEGTARRTSAGAGGITIRADGGTNVTVPASSGSLVLIGDVTGPSHVQLGGAAGFRHTSGDVVFVSFLVTCDELLFDPGPFECTHDSIPVDPGAVAATNITVLHVTNVGDIIDIPSTTGVGPFAALPTGRRWTDIVELVPGVIPLENRAATLGPGPNSDVIVFTLWNTGVNQNHLGATRVPPPYDGTGATFQTDIDVGPLYGAHRVCTPAPNQAVVPYIRWNVSNYDVFTAEYDGTSWSTAPVAATSSQDYQTVTCFQTTHGLFFKTFNNSTNAIEVFKRGLSGEFESFASFDSSYFSGTPGSPFSGAPIGKAASLGNFGSNLHDSAGITVGLSNGTVEFGRLTTTTPPTLVTTNLGSADGETSVNLGISPRGDIVYGVGWQDQDVLRGGFGLFLEPLSGIETVTLGSIDTGTMIDAYQGIATAMGPDGHFYVGADKFYEIHIDGPGPPAVHQLSDYPYQTLGGPFHLVFPDGAKVGFGPGPGSQMLGILAIVEIFSDGLETGDTVAW